MEHIAEDAEGYLWFATISNGVSRFDGNEFVNFTTKDGLCNNKVFSIYLDSQERLWFGTDEGACWYDGRSFHCFSEDDVLSQDWISFIFEDSRGHLWFAGHEMMGFYDDKKFSNLKPDYIRDCGDKSLSSSGWGECWGITEDARGQIWFGFEGCLLNYDGEHFHRVLEDPKRGSPAFSVTASDEEGRLWIGGQGFLGQFKTDQRKGLEILHDFGSMQARKIQRDRQGRVWFLTGRGAYWFEDGGFQCFTPQDGLAFSSVNAMLEDREGHLWFATWGGGVNCYDPQSIQCYTEVDGLPQSKVNCLWMDRQGILWMGFGDMAIPSVNQIARFDGTAIAIIEGGEGKEFTRCYTFYEDRNGRLWIASSNGLGYLDNGRVGSIDPQREILSGAVTVVTGDRQGRLLIGHEKGDTLQILRYDGHVISEVVQVNYRWHVITAVLESRDHDIWFTVGTQEGVFKGGCVGRFNEKTGIEFYEVENGLPHNTAEDIIEDRNGNLWIATVGGASKFDGKKFHNFGVENGLPNNHVQCIYEDREGDLWFGTEGGVARYNGHIFQTIDSDLIGSTSQITEGSNGIFWFATINGLVRYVPSHIPPRLRLGQVIADRIYRAEEEITIYDSVKQLIFEFRGMSFRTPLRNMLYTYRLSGYEDNWQKPTREIRAYYQDLSPGEYVFQVRAIDRDLNFSEVVEKKLKVVPDLRDQKIIELEELVRERTQDLEKTHRRLQEAQAQIINELEEELQTAHDMQMGLMPTESPIIKGFDISGRCIPANHVGGDFFQYFQISDDRIAISLADVTGHAMEAAVPVMMFSGVLESEIKHGESLADLFPSLNQTLHKTLDKRTFVCFAMGELDTATRKFRFSNGGCPYPYHFKASTGQISELQVDAYPLGVRAEATYPVIEAQLAPGDRVIFCSDGIIEAENSQEEMFGFERTAETIRKGCQDDLSAPQLLDYLINEVKTFTGEASQGDDMTVVVLKVEV
ncbi:SpoIIE family protein phosphatase [Candidatus Bathyarchaeota archaeon]|nr:SpoIIE family protein phosphatase [Candidatus Bathyarchaeota archaeon]